MTESGTKMEKVDKNIEDAYCDSGTSPPNRNSKEYGQKGGISVTKSGTRDTKRCSRCKKIKGILEFSYIKTRNRYEAECKDCAKERKRTAYKKKKRIEKRRKRNCTGFITAIGKYPSWETIEESSKMLGDLMKELTSEGLL